MDLNNLINSVVAAAKAAAAIIPGGQGAALAIGVGEKLVGVIDDLFDSAPDTRTQAEMQAARKELAAAVSAKAERTADRFD
jgi:hypothetical protein